MGYTHYWSFVSTRGKSRKIESLYQKAVLECAQVVRYWYTRQGGISGYTAHTKPGDYGGILFNGKGDNACEDFVLREHFTQNDNFNFCKTNRYEYDILVVACLAILTYRLGDAIQVSSDGDTSDWAAGVNLAQTVLRRRVKIPPGIRPGKSKLRVVAS